MSGSNRRLGPRALGGPLGALLVVVIVAGCGHDGTADVTLRPTPQPIVGAVTGTVFAPDGQFAAADVRRRWPKALCFASPAYAQTCLQDLLPAGGVLNVALWHITALDAKDGEIDDPRLINQARTDTDGVYEIVDPAAEHLEACRLMVVVGRDESLTRAFAIEQTTNLDPVSEAVVRLVLDRLTKAPPVQLCDFANAGLANILEEARQAACTAKGSTVGEINDDAYEDVQVNCDVLQAMNDATGVPIPLPPKCP